MTAVAITRPRTPAQTTPAGGAWLPVWVGDQPTTDTTGGTPGHGFTEWPVFAGEHRAAGRVRRGGDFQWTAWRKVGRPAPFTAPTRTQALAGLGLLDTVEADEFGIAIQSGLGADKTTEALPFGPFDMRLVLCDGTLVVVDDIPKARVKEVTLACYVLGRVAIQGASPVDWEALDITAPSSRMRVTLKLNSRMRLALAPACQHCAAPAGRQCADECQDSPIQLI